MNNIFAILILNFIVYAIVRALCVVYYSYKAFDECDYMSTQGNGVVKIVIIAMLGLTVYLAIKSLTLVLLLFNIEANSITLCFYEGYMLILGISIYYKKRDKIKKICYREIEKNFK